MKRKRRRKKEKEEGEGGRRRNDGEGLAILLGHLRGNFTWHNSCFARSMPVGMVIKVNQEQLGASERSHKEQHR